MYARCEELNPSPGSCMRTDTDFVALGIHNSSWNVVSLTCLRISLAIKLTLSSHSDPLRI